MTRRLTPEERNELAFEQNSLSWEAFEELKDAVAQVSWKMGLDEILEGEWLVDPETHEDELEIDYEGGEEMGEETIKDAIYALEFDDRLNPAIFQELLKTDGIWQE